MLLVPLIYLLWFGHNKMEQLKKQSVAMVDQVQSYLGSTKERGNQPELTLSDKNFTELSSRLSFDSSKTASRGQSLRSEKKSRNHYLKELLQYFVSCFLLALKKDKFGMA